MQFYNVRKKEKVEIDDSKVEAVEYKRTTKNGKNVVRYGVRAVDDDGTKLTKFCNKEVYDSLNG